MSSNTFEIAFSGVLAPGADPMKVKQGIAALFRTELAKVEPLFSGKRFVIKKGLDQATALKYQHALREVGAMVEVVATAAAPTSSAVSSPAVSATSANVPSREPAKAEPEITPAEPDRAGALAGVTIDPPGTVLVAPQQVAPLQVDLSAFSLDPAGVTLIAPTVVPDLQLDLSGMTLAAPGTILKEPDAVTELEVEIDALTMAEPGTILVESQPSSPPNIDTSNLRLV